MKINKLCFSDCIKCFLIIRTKTILLTQQDIIDILEREYGLVVERKAIGRNISYLNEMGIDVESSRKGAYLVDRPIEKSELHMLIDSVLCSTHISATHSKQLIDKLVRMGRTQLQIQREIRGNRSTIGTKPKTRRCFSIYR